MPGVGAVLKADPTLPELQEFIAQKIKEQGFDNETTQDNFMLLVKEVGELAKALRPLHGTKVADDAATQNIEYEAADVFWLLVCVCNSLGIDLEQAIRAKEAQNQKRTWR